jgi:hypothetical protein
MFQVSVPEGAQGPCWTFNGDQHNPTVQPSILVDKDRPERRCHLFIENGNIRYLSDCHHALRGKTVPMEAWP